MFNYLILASKNGKKHKKKKIRILCVELYLFYCMMASSGYTLLDLEETSFLVFECIPLYCWKGHGVEK